MTGCAIMCSQWISLCQHLSLQQQRQRHQQQRLAMTLFYKFLAIGKSVCMWHVLFVCLFVRLCRLHFWYAQDIPCCQIRITRFYCQWNEISALSLSFCWLGAFIHSIWAWKSRPLNYFVYWNFWVITVITCLSESQFACVWVNAIRVIIH